MQPKMTHAERKAAAMATKPLPAHAPLVEAPDDGRCTACGAHVEPQSLLCRCNNR